MSRSCYFSWKFLKASPLHIGVEISEIVETFGIQAFFYHFFLLKNATLAFEGVDAKGGRLDLATIESVMDDLMKPGLGHWNGPSILSSLARLGYTFCYRFLIYVSGFYRLYISPEVAPLSPTCIFLLSHLAHSRALSPPCALVTPRS
jgi:hypothetical protein